MLQRKILLISGSVILASTFGIFGSPVSAASETEASTGITSSSLTASNTKAAEDILRESCDFYRRLRGLSGKVITTVGTERNGKTSRALTKLAFKFNRPNTMRITGQTDEAGNSESLLRAQSSTLYSRKRRMIVNIPSSKWPEIFDNEDLNFVTNGDLTLSLLRDLISDDPFTNIMHGVSSIRFDGLNTSGGKACNHLTLSKDGHIVELWIEAGKRPWLKSIRPFPKQKNDQTTYEIIAHYEHLVPNPPLIASYKSHPHTSQVTHFISGPDQENAYPLLNKQAPDFTATALDGEKFCMSNLRNEVVLMDFWATWCGPCCRELPIVSAVADTYKDRKVKFLAVSQDEESRTVRTFWAKTPYSLQVLMDRDKKIGYLYHVGGIPQIVIIGNDGKVRSAHIGMTGNLKETLTKEIDQALQN